MFSYNTTLSKTHPKKRYTDGSQKSEKGLRIVTYVEVPILMCSPEGGSHSYGNLPYNIQLSHFLM
jgi:hypothetical protein